MRKYLEAFICLAITVILIIFSPQAALGCREGLNICSSLIIPSLFPFFVLSGIITGLNMPQLLGKLLSPFSGRLFGVSGVGATALIMGLSCGYPMGAVYIADMKKRELISAEEAERLMGFCSNSGFGFIIAAVGCGVFGSAKYGVLLYLTHAFSAVTVGILLKKALGELSFTGISNESAFQNDADIFSLLTVSVKTGTVNMLNVCGFVIIFSSVISLLDANSLVSMLCASFSRETGVELYCLRSLFYGIFELGCSVAQMRTLNPSPSTLSLAAFILGWGGLSVHMQSLSVAHEAKIKGTLHFTGHLMCAGTAAIYTYFLSTLFF